MFSWLGGQENGALGPIACYSGRYAHLVGVVALDTKSFNLRRSETDFESLAKTLRHASRRLTSTGCCARLPWGVASRGDDVLLLLSNGAQANALPGWLAFRSW